MRLSMSREELEEATAKVAKLINQFETFTEAAEEATEAYSRMISNLTDWEGYPPDRSSRRNRIHSIIVCGSQNWMHEQPIWTLLDYLWPEEVHQGGATGADRIAAEWAMANGVPYETHRAHWDRYGREAGPVRNAEMLQNANPDLVVGFSHALTSGEPTPGTKDMLTRANNANTPTWWIRDRRITKDQLDALWVTHPMSKRERQQGVFQNTPLI